MYGFIEMSDLEVMLQTCNKTERPPKPSRKAVKIIFIEIAFICMLDIKEIPFVISKSPVNRGVMKVGDICNVSNTGSNKLKTKKVKWLA